MPNTLAHLGVQTLATRVAVRRADVRWVFIGATVPDVPWIIGRATSTLVPRFHDYDLWAYLIAQSSLAVSLILCAALAAVATRAGRTFAILSVNASLHLILDGIQTKWGSGAHVLAPFSWHDWDAGWFAIESWPTFALTSIGIIIAIRAIGAARRSSPIATTLTTSRLALFTLALTAYLLAPIP